MYQLNLKIYEFENYFRFAFLFQIDTTSNFEIEKARVAKLVDAPSSGGGIRKDVLVRIRSRALLYNPL